MLVLHVSTGAERAIEQRAEPACSNREFGCPRLIASGTRLAHRIGYIDRRGDKPEILEGVGDLLLFGDHVIADRQDPKTPSGKRYGVKSRLRSCK